MFPKGTQDPEYPADAGQAGIRLDNRNLVQEWLANHKVMWVLGQGPRQCLGQSRSLRAMC